MDTLKREMKKKKLNSISADKYKVLKKYTELWDALKYHIKTINGGKAVIIHKYF